MSVGKGFMLKRFLAAVACMSVLVVPLAAWSDPVNSGPNTSTTVATSAPDYSWRHQISAPKQVEVYKVRRDDTLSGIARKFDLNWKKVYCANKKKIGNDPNILQVHVKLKIRESKRVWCDISPPHVKSVNTTSVQTTSNNSTPIESTTQSSQRYSGGSGFQQCVIMAESGGDPTAYNPSSGASGLYGFLLSTWDSLGLGYPGGAYTAPVSVQNEGFAILYARDGTSPWAPYDGC